MNSSNYFLVILFVISTIALVLAILAFTKKKGDGFRKNFTSSPMPGPGPINATAGAGGFNAPCSTNADCQSAYLCGVNRATGSTRVCKTRSGANRADGERCDPDMGKEECHSGKCNNCCSNVGGGDDLQKQYYCCPKGEEKGAPFFGGTWCKYSYDGKHHCVGHDYCPAADTV